MKIKTPSKDLAAFKRWASAHPFHTALLSFGLGMLVGVIASSRHRTLFWPGVTLYLAILVGWGVVVDSWARKMVVIFLCAFLVAAPWRLQAGEFDDLPLYPATIAVAYPDQDPNNPQPLLGLVCVGAAIGIAGYVGIKICSKILKIWEHQVTNNQNQAQSPLPFEAASPPPTDPGVPHTGAPAPATGGDDCGCGLPQAPDQLPVVFESSVDGVAWSTLSSMPRVGSMVKVPLTGLWRVRPLLLTVTRNEHGAVAHVPPGILEHSLDLLNWTAVSTNSTQSDIKIGAGFYRVKL